MKTKTIFASLFAVAALTGCSNENEVATDSGGQTDLDVAYLSIKVQAESMARAVGSDEEDGLTDESEIKSLYLLTFNDQEVIKGVPGGDYYVKIDNPTVTIPAQKVSGAATKLLVIANPGPLMQDMLAGGISSTTTFSTINQALIKATHEGLTGTDGFTMINCGDDSKKNATPPNNIIDEPLIDIKTSIKKPADFATAADPDKAAKDAAEAAKVTVNIERLASKIEFALGKNVDAGTADFKLTAWTLDGVNSRVFPWANKTIISVIHSVTGGGTAFYKNNFYTTDPNFRNDVGISKATIDATTHAPILVKPYKWETGVNAPTIMYCIENTMDAPSQLFGNATRLVFKGTYFPDGFTVGDDWYHFAGVNYKTFQELMDAYNASASPSNLRTACTNFYDKVKAKYSAKIGANDFSELTQQMLDDAQIENGGEIVKNNYLPGDHVIRWYQKGLCYWYYEIRHDNSPNAGEMAFGKYGVVRNNWYRLTLNSVNGPGTPWFPDIDHPGPGDPDPTDPIDASAGYLGITVNVAPWIVWETGIDI